MSNQSEWSGLELAIVGMAGRFPGAESLEQYWDNLSRGVESITLLTDQELEESGVDRDLIENPRYVKAAPLLAGHDLFDASFFGFNPREAAILDPQQRVFLECAWEAFEDAGYVAQEFNAPIGVFAGSSMATYLLFNLFSRRRFMGTGETFELLVGNDKDYLATRVAYKLDLKGPSMSVQTACSTSLVAVHLACQSLLNYQCDMALAGGVSVRVPQKVGYLAQDDMIFSPDGHCRAFDAKGRGTIFGSGVGAVVLRRLEDAIRDRDPIRAVIKGTAVNNDGAVKIGFTAPSQASQAEVIATALANAEVEAESITAIEAHGTGTALGDPIEFAALCEAFDTDETGYCAVSAVKSNIGHLEAAAGAAGLIKTVLALEHGQLPPSVHFEEPNPEIRFDDSPFFLNTGLREWPRSRGPRRAGVSSFGIGGTNAHLILQEAPPSAAGSATRPWRLLVLSARTPSALEAATERFRVHLDEHPEIDFADLAHTLKVGRQAMRHRKILVASDRHDALAALRDVDPERIFVSNQERRDRPTAFLFPGQGAQYPNMALDLYRHESSFREAVDRGAELLRPLLGVDPREILFPPDEALEEAAETLRQTRITQPVLFLVEHALAQLWTEWGIRPDVMIGHSVGELVAACLSGVVSYADAVRLVAHRGRLMQSAEPGSMLSVPLSEDEARAELDGALSLAAVNAPRLCVVAGPTPEIDALARRLEDRGLETSRLRTSHAYHSEMMDPILDEFREVVSGVELREPRLPYISNLSGTWITAEEATDPDYWVRHVRQTVRFADGLGEVLGENRILLEVGPGQALGTLARRHPAFTDGALALGSLRRPREEVSDVAHLLTTLGRLWLGGACPDWSGFHAGEQRRRVRLPTYPFERRRYWIEARPSAEAEDGELELAAGSADGLELAGVHGRPDLQTVYVAPRTETETALGRIWQRLLGIGGIGVHDNFFELGGHSLLATQIVVQVKEIFHLQVALAELFEKPTLAGLADCVERHGGRAADDVAITAREIVVQPDPEHAGEPFSLTDMQQAQWIGRIGAFNVGNVAAHVYFEPESTDLDLDRLQRAWRRMIRRHGMLRAIVEPEGRQKILDQVPAYEIEVLDLRGEDPQAVADRLAEVREHLSHRMRPTDQWPLFEVRATRLDGGRTRVHFSFDLLIADIASLRIIFREWSQFYEDPERELAELEITFRDYVTAAARLEEGEGFERALEYWRERLPTLPPAPELPLAVQQTQITRPRFERWGMRLEPEVWQRLKARAAQKGLSPSAVILAAFAELLAAWSKSPRFAINVTVINRLPLHPQVGRLVGEFASFAPLEVDSGAAQSFIELARNIRTRSWQDLENRLVSGVRILRELARIQGGTAGAVMPVVFTSTLIHSGEGEDEFPISWLGDMKHVISQTPQVWMDHSLFEDRGGLLLSWVAVAELFPKGMLDDMFAAYEELIGWLAAEDDHWEQRAPILVPAAQLDLHDEVNATEKPLGDQLLHSLVDEAAVRYPELPAVITGERTWTHRELASRSRRLGRFLRRLDLPADSLVAIVMEKGWEQIVGVLATLHAGWAYLPVDPRVPGERLRYLLENGRVRVALTQADLDRELEWPDEIERVVAAEATLGEIDDAPLEPIRTADDLAYVIFTSGSTGQPKGVMIEHRGAVNTLLDINRRFDVRSTDRVLALSALNFDLSVYDIFGVLAAGGAVVLPEPARGRDPRHWLELIESRDVTLWNSVPQLMTMLVEYAEGHGAALPSSLRLALLSGDWIPVSLPERVRRAAADDVRLVSLGGATEASIWSIFHPVTEVDEAWESIPYGRPLDNQTFHVFDKDLCPRPVWVPGDLYIGGVGVARGYWRDEEKTAASFVVHPETGERLYRTGDLGRYLPDGDIEFLGREDLQVKIHGYRIELGEIEAALAQHPEVLAAVVAALGEARHRSRLAGYVVPRDPASPPEIAELRDFLRDKVPDYMVPADIVLLEKVPLTPNGKVDRAALPAPTREGTAGTEPPEGADEMAEELARFVSEVLGIEQVGIHDNFFEMGGDSILGIQVLNRANEAGFEISAQQLFEHPTIVELARVIRRRPVDRAEQGAVEGEVPLTPEQRRLLDRVDPRSAVRRLCLETGERLASPVIESALAGLVDHHDALRLEPRGDDPRTQRHTAPGRDPLRGTIDLSTLPAPVRDRARRAAEEQLSATFDPRSAPRLAGALFEIGSDRPPELLLLADSGAVDDASWPILVRDLEHSSRELAAGRSPELPPKTYSFKRWAERLAADASDFATEFAGWLGEIPDAAAAANPLGSNGDATGNDTPAEIRVTLDAEETRALRGEALEAYQNTVEEVLLTALVRTVPGSAARHMIVETARDGRGAFEDLDVSRTIGCFTTLVPVCFDLDDTDGPGDRLKAVKERLRSLPQEGVGHGLRGPETGDGSPAAPEVRFVYTRLPDELASTLFTVREPEDCVGPPRSCSDRLEVIAWDAGDRLAIDWRFPEEVYPRSLVEDLARRCLDALRELLRHCASPEVGSFTPSDFPEADVSQQELDRFIDMFNA